MTSLLEYKWRHFPCLDKHLATHHCIDSFQSNYLHFRELFLRKLMIRVADWSDRDEYRGGADFVPWPCYCYQLLGEYFRMYGMENLLERKSWACKTRSSNSSSPEKCSQKITRLLVIWFATKLTIEGQKKRMLFAIISSENKPDKLHRDLFRLWIH